MDLFKTKKKSQSKFIALFGADRIKFFEFLETDNKVKLQDEFSVSWNKATLISTITTVVNDRAIKQVDIVLADQLAFHQFFALESKTNAAKIDQLILDKGQELLPEPLTNLGLDYSIIEGVGNHAVVTLYAVKKSLLNLLAEAFSKNNVSLGSIESLASVAANLSSRDKQISILLLDNDGLYLVVCAKSKVLTYLKVNEADIYNSVKSLLSSIESRFANIPIKILMTKNLKPDTKRQLSDMSSQVEVEEVELDLTKALAEKTSEFEFDTCLTDTNTTAEPLIDSRTTSRESVIIKPASAPIAPKPPLQVNKEGQEMSTTNVLPPKQSNAKLVVVLITVFVVLIGVVAGGFFVYQNAMRGVDSEPQVIESEVVVPSAPVDEVITESSQSAEASPSSQVTEIDKTEVSIRVLNGSGIPGEAGKAADLIKADGFTTVTTGNADSYDYEETEVSVKDGQELLFELVRDALSQTYTVTRGKDLATSARTDVEVIVGQE